MIRSPRGTQDILPEQWRLWGHVTRAAAETAEASGFERIETPTFEETGLFTHATGEHTDVHREMYTFEDRGGDELSLRPEGTASVFRAYFQHGMHVKPQPVRLYYVEPMFRYERPQAGRLREHHQFGCEAIGSGDALLDASMLDLQGRFYRAAGLPDLSIHVNSIGDGNCRPGYLKELVAYLNSHQDELCEQCRDRIQRNPLRVLDCKKPSCQPILEQAPRTLDHLCTDCRDHWERFLRGLKALSIQPSIDSRLVRGLDYYTRTVWEYIPQVVTGATSTVGGGGRYDDLATTIGGKPTPAVGFSTGLERVLLHIRPEVTDGLERASVDVIGTHVGEEAELVMLSITGQLLARGASAVMGFGTRSLKAQLRQGDSLGARIALIAGEDELKEGTVTVRDLRTGTQERIAKSEVVDAVLARIA